MTEEAVLPSSFRDPSGLVFRRGTTLLRQVNESYREDYDHLIGSGLYDRLVAAGSLVAHEEQASDEALTPGAYKVLRPEVISFISYPYEWCFGQLKDAALLTLEIQKTALDHGMSLKDASAFNVQWRGGKPILIDTLSFERLRENTPWVAYRQFCQHFLAPLGLMAYRDVRLGQLSRVHIDGVPLDIAAELMPLRARARFPLLLHVFLHAKHQRRHEGSDPRERARARPFSLGAFRGLIDSLTKAVNKLEGRMRRKGWTGYYEEQGSYSVAGMQHKKEIVAAFIDGVRPGRVWDLGANTGLFGRMAAARGAEVICFDMDPLCVEENYRVSLAENVGANLPLVMDLTNPSPGLGWDNAERSSLRQRGPADMALALALIHHLAIANNVPLARAAEFFRSLCEWLVVEWVPKQDPRVGTLLAGRDDIFDNYTQEGFEEAFSQCFEIEAREDLKGSERVLYLMRARRG
ncbi:nodulation protein NoeA [soil metagenome]